MKTINLIKPWGAVLCEHPREAMVNILEFREPLKYVENVVGMGYSGATIIGMLIGSGLKYHHNYVLMRKDNDPKLKDWTYKLTPGKIAIVDDHILHGRTLRMIAKQLGERCKDVTLIIAKHWDIEQPQYTEQAKVTIQELFPNVMVWIH